MTRDDILAVKPGREMDALVAEKVFGLEVVAKDYPYDEDYECGFVSPSHYPQSPQHGPETLRRPVYIGPDGTWPPEPRPNYQPTGDCFDYGPVEADVEAVPEYSTDLAAAWGVIERLQELGWLVALDLWPKNTVILALIAREGPGCKVLERTEPVPLVICRAALLAVMDLA